MTAFSRFGAALGTMILAVSAQAAAPAQPEYVTIRMEISVAKPAAEVWSKVGKYCDIAAWLMVECKITSGDGGIGTVRSLDSGRVSEILVAQTELSYGYTQPVVEGKFYNLYHGFMEARPVTGTTSKLIYTLMLDVSDKPDQAAKDADVTRRRGRFETALKNMKGIAEGTGASAAK
ncbi:MAG: SRPBCC family protein [Steroidobacteraceae bacterium]